MSTLHFRCSFDVSSEKAKDPWADLLRTVRKWIAKRAHPASGDRFWEGWFFRGGEWRSCRASAIRVLTRAYYGNATEENPNYWAVEYEHPCDEFPGCRTWRTHAGIEQFASNEFHLRLQVSYDIRAGYIGLPPRVPIPSSPGLVTKLLTSSFWQCTIGTEQLLVAPQVLHVGQGRQFEQLLGSNERTCSVVLVSQVYPNLGYIIEPAELSRLLAGTSMVFCSESSEVDEELEYVLGRRFSCWNGMIRIYAPNLDFERKGDYKRHRFILRKDVESWGPDRTKEIIVTGLARRSQRRREVLTPLDVERVSRKRYLAKLRAQQDARGDDEWTRELEEYSNELEQENTKLESDKTYLRERITTLTDEVHRLRSDKHSLKENLKEAGRAAYQRNRSDLNDLLRELPKSLLHVVQILQQVHSERIVFTDQALQSASEARFGDIHAAWKTLWAMGTHLHAVFFEQDGGNKEKTFQDQCGIQLAMTEGKLTKRNPKLMSLRKDTYKGEEIDITPHVKFDDDTTRAYFCPFRKHGAKLIVVGYIGHLDTAGTRRRKD